MAGSLRALSSGELLRQAVRTYRERFGLFVGIAAVPNMLELALRIAARVWGRDSKTGVPSSCLAPPASGSAVAHGFWVLTAAIVPIAVASLVTGATVRAVSNLRLGRAISIGASLRAIRGNTASIAFTSLWAALFAAIPVAVGGMLALLITPLIAGYGRLPFGALALLLALAGAAAGIRLALEFAVAVPALLIEGLGIFAALRRSTELTEGCVGRVLVVALLPATFGLTLWGLFSGLAVAVGGLHSSLVSTSAAWAAIRAYAVGVLAMPMGAICASLLFFDLKARKEALGA